MVEVSLVIIQYGDYALLDSLLSSLNEHEDLTQIDDVVIVNNGATLTDEQRDRLKRLNISIRLYDNEKESYSSGVNAGVRFSKGDIVMISNNDVEWLPGYTVRPLLKWLENDSIGVVGPQQVYPDGSWQRSYGQIPSIKSALLSVFFLDSLGNLQYQIKFKLGRLRVSSPEYIDGAFMCVKRECFDDIGGFDESLDFYGEDVDFCHRAQNSGWKLIFDPSTRVIHLRGASSSTQAEAAYAERLNSAKKEIVARQDGKYAARLFEFFHRISLWERALIYPWIASILGGSWVEKAERAKARFQGVNRL